MSVPNNPSDRHREFSQAFADVAAKVEDWTAPTPVEGWQARDVVSHLIEWFPPLLNECTGISIPATSAAIDKDPIGAWNERSEVVQGILDDPKLANQLVAQGSFKGMPVAQLMDLIYSSDIFMHRWDLAKAAGSEANLDPDFCNELIAGLARVEEELRSAGHYGPAIAVPESASAEDRLIGFIGRDPGWRT